MRDTDPEAATYAHRCCPHCGSERRGQRSVHSDPAAERLPFARVLEQWDTDIFNDKSYFSYFRCSDCGLLIGLVGFNVEIESEGLFVLAVHAHSYDCKCLS